MHVCFQKTACMDFFNSFPNRPWFSRVCSASLLKTLWEKENLLVTSNFSFSHSVFYPLGRIFIIFEIVVCKLFQFGRVQNLSFGKGLILYTVFHTETGAVMSQNNQKTCYNVKPHKNFLKLLSDIFWHVHQRATNCLWYHLDLIRISKMTGTYGFLATLLGQKCW